MCLRKRILRTTRGPNKQQQKIQIKWTRMHVQQQTTKDKYKSMHIEYNHQYKWNGMQIVYRCMNIDTNPNGITNKIIIIITIISIIIIITLILWIKRKNLDVHKILFPLCFLSVINFTSSPSGFETLKKLLDWNFVFRFATVTGF